MKEMPIIQLTCKSCGATMIVGKDRPIISCPYCHSTEMIQEGDEVWVFNRGKLFPMN